jgi:hypothetical protein
MGHSADFPLPAQWGGCLSVGESLALAVVVR